MWLFPVLEDLAFLLPSVFISAAFHFQFQIGMAWPFVTRFYYILPLNLFVGMFICFKFKN